MSDAIDNNTPSGEAKRDTRAHWPADVTGISVKGIGRLGVDSKRQLYWDGRRIEIEKRLDLTTAERRFAIIVGIAAVVGGLGSGLKDGADFMCQRGWWKQIFCASEQASHAVFEQKD